MTTFWNIGPCSLVETDVSEVHTAVIIGEMNGFDDEGIALTSICCNEIHRTTLLDHPAS
jgi:hypothetical protein